MHRFELLPCVLGFAWLVGCGAGEAARPKEALQVQPRTNGGTSCRLGVEEPVLVVDWQPEVRADLELAMKQGIAVVHYDCNEVRVLRECRAEGAYPFAAEPRDEKVYALGSADEMKARLPLTGGAIAASLGRSSSLDVALVTVGKRTTPVSRLGVVDLQGDCAGATHFVRGADVGAFAVRRGSAGAIRTAAQVFGAGVSASSTSSLRVENTDGEYATCSQATAGAARPPAQCSALVRLQLGAVGAR